MDDLRHSARVDILASIVPMQYSFFLGPGIVLLVVFFIFLLVTTTIRRNRELKENARRERVAKMSQQLENTPGHKRRAVEIRLAWTENSRAGLEASPSKRPPGSETAPRKSKSFHA